MKNSRFFYIGGIALLLALLIVIVPWYPWQLSGGLLLIAFLPGYALLLTLWPHRDEQSPGSLARWLIAVPISYSLTTTLLLVLVLAHLPLTDFSVAAGLGSLTLLFSLMAWRRTSANERMMNQQIANDQKESVVSYSPLRPFAPSPFVYSLILILLLAAVFRLVNIHYSDYQGDEADILLRAVGLVYGQTEAMWTHSKGPGEILLLDAIGTLTGRFDEQTARLPFALAGIMSVGLLTWLGQQLFNRRVGLVVGLLAALDGVFVSYARTAQYQSVVLLLTLAAISCFYYFYQGGGTSRRWHGLGAFLLAASFLFHFETILLLPLVAYLTVGRRSGGVGEQESRGDEAREGWSFFRLTNHRLTNPRLIASRLTMLWPSALIFVVIVCAFYAPFLLDPNIKSTGNYLENRIGGGVAPPFDNLPHFFYEEALKYNSAYYVALFDGLLLIAAIMILVGQGTRSEGRDAGAKFLPRSSVPLLLCLLILGGAGLALIGQTWPSALLLAAGLALFFGLIIFSPQTGAAQRLLWLWLAPPFWIYVFWVNRPGKHHYLFLGALTLLVGWVVVQGWHWGATRWPGLGRPAGRWLSAGLGIGLVAIFAAHAWLLFLRSDLEYVLTYPAHKSSFYPTDTAYPYSTRIGFGYPFRLGWQLAGQLRRTGQLEGSWAGNDDGNAPRWYMLGTPPTPCYPRYVLRGEITYKGDDDFDVPFDPTNFGYAPHYRLWGNDRLRLTIWEFQPLDPAPVVDLYETPYFEPPVTAADFAGSMAAGTPSPQVPLEPALVLGEGSELKNNAPPEYLARAKQLDGRVALLGYDLDESYARPGSIVPLTLYWQIQSLLRLRYKVFAHLIAADGRNWTQADDFPVCGTSQTNAWAVGERVLDRHLLKLPPDLPPGDYTLVVGMYEPDLNLRLNYFDIAGNEQGNSLTVGTLNVKTLKR